MEENIHWKLLNIVTLPVDLGRVWECACFWLPLETEDGTLAIDTDIFLFKDQLIMETWVVPTQNLSLLQALKLYAVVVWQEISDQLLIESYW